jgi:hypothetical protein
MGTTHPGVAKPGILLLLSPLIPALQPDLCKLWKTRPLCIASLLQPLVPCASGRSFHTKQPLCTGLFQLPLQVVGNRERYIPPNVLFSKCPLFHSQDLENLPPCQSLSCESLRLNFHFSCHTTGTTGFYLSLYPPFPTTVASLRRKYLCRRPPSPPAAPTCDPTPRNPDNPPVFHAHIGMLR